MEDKQLQKNEFIREKIKEKPISRKHVISKLLLSGLSGLVFALVACVVFVVAWPILQAKERDKDSQNPAVDETEEVVFDTQDIGTAPPEQGSIVPAISLQDYQAIQNQLYQIGTRVNKSIVTVTGVSSDTDMFHNSYEIEGNQAGVIVKDTGSELLILTERRALMDANRIQVTFIDETYAEAVLKKYDKNTGLAILSVSKSELQSATTALISVAQISNSATVSNGSIVIALGRPLGTSYSILTGHITSSGTEVSVDDHNFSVLMTDMIAEQNASGFLINTQGTVIGMIAPDIVASQSGNALKAIALSDLTQVVSMLSSGQDIPYLGLQIATVTEKMATTYKLPMGVYIREVAMDSPAMSAGLQSGDIITSINGETVSTSSTYGAKILNLSPGDSVPFVVKRQGADGYSEITVFVDVGVLQ